MYYLCLFKILQLHKVFGFSFALVFCSKFIDCEESFLRLKKIVKLVWEMTKCTKK